MNVILWQTKWRLCMYTLACIIPKKECGLSDKEFKTSKQLEDHQTKCEIFMCSNSHCRDTFKTLEGMKEHINNDHRKTSPAHYQFSYWICMPKTKVKKKSTKSTTQFILKTGKIWSGTQNYNTVFTSNKFTESLQ